MDGGAMACNALGQGDLELVDVDGAGAIGIEEVESLLDLLNLVLGKSVLGHFCFCGRTGDVSWL